MRLNHVENLLANQQTGPPPEAVSRQSSPGQASSPEDEGSPPAINPCLASKGMIMITSERFSFTLDPQADRGIGREVRRRASSLALGTATSRAHTVGGVWAPLVNGSNRKRSAIDRLLTLGLAFGLGVFTGWLVKRR